jgi:biuret amidohydrolase
MVTMPVPEPQAVAMSRPVLVVVDTQLDDYGTTDAIPVMEGYRKVVENGIRLVNAARKSGVPVIFLLERHSRTHVDFGRELDGSEDIHCLEDDPLTQLVPELTPLRDEYLVPKRRYSGFFGTDLEILLRGLGANTLILFGALTDVCVHYTFVDAHQFDYFVRVAIDAVIGSTQSAHEAALAAMQYLQRDSLCTTDDLEAALLSYTGPRRPPVISAERT